MPSLYFSLHIYILAPFPSYRHLSIISSCCLFYQPPARPFTHTYTASHNTRIGNNTRESESANRSWSAVYLLNSEVNKVFPFPIVFPFFTRFALTEQCYTKKYHITTFRPPFHSYFIIFRFCFALPPFVFWFEVSSIQSQLSEKKKRKRNWKFSFYLFIYSLTFWYLFSPYFPFYRHCCTLSTTYKERNRRRGRICTMAVCS